MLTFAAEYKGTLVTESMLVAGLNATVEAAQGSAEYLWELTPEVACLSVPTRPLAEKGVCPPDETTMNFVPESLSVRQARCTADRL